MRKIVYFLFLIVVLFGCATLPVKDLISDTRKTGATHMFDYPYQDVFEVRGQALLNTTQTIEISEENINKGYIFARTFSWHLQNNSIGPQFKGEFGGHNT